jgi:hypothetical protein
LEGFLFRALFKEILLCFDGGVADRQESGCGSFDAGWGELESGEVLRVVNDTAVGGVEVGEVVIWAPLDEDGIGG